MESPSPDLEFDFEALVYAEEVAREKAKTSFKDFTLYTKPDFVCNWHHDIIFSYLERVVSGDIKRLMLFEPPRHGKTEQVSRRLPAYTLGRDPDTPIIATSYSDSLAADNNRDVQRIIDSDDYRRIFPATRLWDKNVRTMARGTWLRNSEVFEVVGRRGVYRSAGIGGGITGKGFKLGIVDDPIKNWEEAYSETIREKHWNWFQSTFMTRIENDSAIVLTLTRWHHDDLAGRIAELMSKDPLADQYIILTFPAVLEQTKPYDQRKIGEILWPGKLDEKRCNRIKAGSSRVWRSLFQQDPSEASGTHFKKEWWKYYTVLPKVFDTILISADMSFSKGDDNSFVVFQVWGRVKDRLYLIHQFRKQMGFVETLKEFRKVLNQYPKADRRLVENKANGPGIIDVLKDKFDIEEVNPEGSKTSRAISVSHLAEEGHVYLPDPSICPPGLDGEKPWVLDFVDEHAKFPKAGHDDQVDAMSQALSELEKELSLETLEDLLDGI